MRTPLAVLAATVLHACVQPIAQAPTPVPQFGATDSPLKLDAAAEAVARGRALFNDTPTHAKPFAGSALSCRNCHLGEGKQGLAAPLSTAYSAYPAYREKNERINSFEDRVQGCFRYSMNAQGSSGGRVPDVADPIIRDLTAYAKWLSETEEPTPRGFPKIQRDTSTRDLPKGKALYQTYCAACHGADGGGQAGAFPPLWGPQSFNWGAGMHRVATAAGFAQHWMPLGQGESLSEDDAWQIAAYITSQPRPADPRDPALAARKHAQHDCFYPEIP